MNWLERADALRGGDRRVQRAAMASGPEHRVLARARGTRPLQERRRLLPLPVRRADGPPLRPRSPLPLPAAVEATQGQIDGLFSRLPYKCHQNRVAYVGD